MALVNSGNGYAVLFSNVGYSAPNSGNGFGYNYSNVGYSAANSGEGYVVNYENVTIYVIANDSYLPPMIN